jgi:hypothetical protein
MPRWLLGKWSANPEFSQAVQALPFVFLAVPHGVAFGLLDEIRG